MKMLFKMIFGLFFKVSIYGNIEQYKKIGKSNKSLIIANHESFLDGLLLGVYLPVEATFVVHTTVLKNRLFKFILSFVNYLAVDTTNPMAMKEVYKLINAGVPVVIFPEGRITTTGSLMKVYDGSSFIAAKTGADIYPVRIDGASKSVFGKLGARHQPVRWFPKISLHFQEKTSIIVDESLAAKVRRKHAGIKMHELMAKMIVDTSIKNKNTTLYKKYLEAMVFFGRKYKVAEDIRLNEDSYGEIHKYICFARAAICKSIGDLSSVGLMLPNTVYTLAFILGGSTLNKRVAIINYTAGKENILSSCVASDVKMLITSKVMIEKAKLDDVIDYLKNNSITIIYTEDLLANLTLTDKLTIGFNNIFTINETSDINSQVVVLFTSGSESKPKAVIHTNRSLITNIFQVKSISDFTPNDKFFVCLPLFHSFGLTCGGLLPLLTGTKLFLYPSPLHYRVIPELVYDKDCTVLFGTSTFLGNYAKFAHQYDFGKLRYVIAGAEKLSDTVRVTWQEKFGIRILEGYGSTECGPVIAVNVPMAAKNGTVGKVVPGMIYRLDAVAGVDSPDGLPIGRLYVKGNNLMDGYMLYDNPGKLKPVEEWYDTGDIVEIDAEGFVKIKGRVKRFAKIAGEMVSLEVSEKILKSACLAKGFGPDTLFAVVNIPSEAKGEKIVGLVPKLKGEKVVIARSELIAAAKADNCSELAIPSEIVYVEAVPLLGTGKTDYQTAKAIVLGQ